MKLEAMLQDAKALRKMQREAQKKNDQPRRAYSDEYLTAARDLCARWLEELHAPGMGGERLLPPSAEKYDVSRAIEGAAPTALPNPAALTADFAGEGEGRADDDLIDAEFTVRNAA